MTRDDQSCRGHARGHGDGAVDGDQVEVDALSFEPRDLHERTVCSRGRERHFEIPIEMNVPDLSKL